MNIIVLCGGLSRERDVSMTSGIQVMRALRERGHKAVLVDLFFGYAGTYDDPKEIFDREPPALAFGIGDREPDLEAVRAGRSQKNDSLLGDNVLEICRAADFTFLALHGGEGENGKLQAALDIEGIQYTGSGYLGSALAMNKTLSKTLFAAHGIATPPGITVNRDEPVHADVGFPCVVKPCSGGSSVGTSIVWDAQAYTEALRMAFDCEDKVIVEQYIRGRELTVGVLSGKAMPVIEIIPKAGFYDYKNKYQPGLTEELCPAPLRPETTVRLQRLAERVAEILLIDAYCRVDFLMSGDGEIYTLEANTLPGMTPTSLIPQMAAAMGLSFGELCERIIEVSMEKYR